MQFMLMKNEHLAGGQSKFSQPEGWPFVRPDDLFNVSEKFFQPRCGRTAIYSARQLNASQPKHIVRPPQQLTAIALETETESTHQNRPARPDIFLAKARPIEAYRRAAIELCLEVHVRPTVRLRTRRGLSDTRPEPHAILRTDEREHRLELGRDGKLRPNQAVGAKTEFAPRGNPRDRSPDARAYAQSQSSPRFPSVARRRCPEPFDRREGRSSAPTPPSDQASPPAPAGIRDSSRRRCDALRAGERPRQV